MWAPSSLSRARIEQKGREGLNSLSAWLIWNTYLLLTLAGMVLRPSNSDWNLHHQPSGSQAFELHHLCSWVPGLQMANHVTSQLPKSPEPMPYTYNKSFYIYYIIYLLYNYIIYIISYWFYFSEEP